MEAPGRIELRVFVDVPTYKKLRAIADEKHVGVGRVGSFVLEQVMDEVVTPGVRNDAREKAARNRRIVEAARMGVSRPLIAERENISVRVVYKVLRSAA